MVRDRSLEITRAPFRRTLRQSAQGVLSADTREVAAMTCFPASTTELKAALKSRRAQSGSAGPALEFPATDRPESHAFVARDALSLRPFAASYFELRGPPCTGRHALRRSRPGPRSEAPTHELAACGAEESANGNQRILNLPTAAMTLNTGQGGRVPAESPLLRVVPPSHSAQGASKVFQKCFECLLQFQQQATPILGPELGRQQSAALQRKPVGVRVLQHPSGA